MRLVAVLADAVGHARAPCASRHGVGRERRQVGLDDHVDDVGGRVVVRQLGQLAVPAPDRTTRRLARSPSRAVRSRKNVAGMRLPRRCPCVSAKATSTVSTSFSAMSGLRAGVQLLCRSSIWGMISESSGRQAQAQPPNVPGPTTQSTPASGTPVNAEASSESARRSSGSRLWTLPLPHDLARIVIS